MVFINRWTVRFAVALITIVVVLLMLSQENPLTNTMISQAQATHPPDPPEPCGGLKDCLESGCQGGNCACGNLCKNGTPACGGTGCKSQNGTGGGPPCGKNGCACNSRCKLHDCGGLGGCQKGTCDGLDIIDPPSYLVGHDGCMDVRKGCCHVNTLQTCKNSWHCSCNIFGGCGKSCHSCEHGNNCGEDNCENILF